MIYCLQGKSAFTESTTKWLMEGWGLGSLGWGAHLLDFPALTPSQRTSLSLPLSFHCFCTICQRCLLFVSLTWHWPPCSLPRVRATTSSNTLVTPASWRFMPRQSLHFTSIKCGSRKPHFQSVISLHNNQLDRRASGTIRIRLLRPSSMWPFPHSYNFIFQYSLV